MQYIAIVRVLRQIDIAGRDTGNQRARQQIAVFFAQWMRHHDFVSRMQPVFCNTPVEHQRGIGAGFGYARLFLQRDRDERIGARGQRPRVVGKPAHPQMIELEARGFEYAEDLHRRRAGFRLKQGVGAQPAQTPQCLLAVHARHHAFK